MGSGVCLALPPSPPKGRVQNSAALNLHFPMLFQAFIKKAPQGPETLKEAFCVASSNVTQKLNNVAVVKVSILCAPSVRFERAIQNVKAAICCV